MGLFLKWNRHYSKAPPEIKEILFETYYSRAQYAFCVGVVTKVESLDRHQIRYVPTKKLIGNLPSISNEIKAKLQQIKDKFESDAAITWEMARDFLGIMILNIDTGEGGAAMENLSRATSLLILLTVPVHPHKGYLQWQLAITRV